MKYLKIVPFLFFLFCFSFGGNTFGQAPCSTLSPVIFTRPHPCFNEYFTSITASGDMGTTSSISITSGCTDPAYTDLSATQGIDAPVGADVVLNVSRYTTNYTAYLSVYIDWNNNGAFESHEYAGWPSATTHDVQLGPSIMSTTYHISPPCGAPAGNFRMRVMLSESLLGLDAPCLATYGQVYDFYFNSYCPNRRLLGDTALCLGHSTTLQASYGCGVWSSSNNAVATVGTNGVVTASNTAGSAVITYNAAVCGRSVDTVTVGPYLAGTDQVCVGRTVTFTASPAGGGWSVTFSNVSVTDGVITGLNPGLDVVWYSVGGCSAQRSIIVPSALVISGNETVCYGGTTTLTVERPGGTWASSNTSVATVGTSGIVTGITPGTVTISYQTPDGGCEGYKTMTVIDPSISASSPEGFDGLLCETKTAQLVGSPSGGTWATSDVSIASVLSTGLVTGQSTGTILISYIHSGCVEIYGIAVKPIPTISGPTSVCVGNSITLTSIASGGTWYCNPFVATITPASGTSAVVTGTTAESSSIISYTEPVWGCKDVHYVDVGGTTITGPSGVCDGSSMSLSGWPTGGSWSSSNTGIATVGTSGIVTSVSAGTTHITYQIGVCFSVKTIVVGTLPSISGTSNLCAGTNTTLTASIGGGSWSSSNSSIASVNSSGSVHGISPGTVSISYDHEGCIASHSITINPSGEIASGPTHSVCAGTTISLVVFTPGGTWSSSNPSVVPAPTSSGTVTTTANGTANITYTVGSCSDVYTATVTTMPSISGNSYVCGSLPNSTMHFSYTATPSGGVWSSASAGIGNISSAGVFTTSGGASGTATIYYTYGDCIATHPLEIVPQPYRTIGSPTIAVTGTYTTSNNVAALPGGGQWDIYGTTSFPHPPHVSCPSTCAGVCITGTFGPGTALVTKCETSTHASATVVYYFASYWHEITCPVTWVFNW